MKPYLMACAFLALLSACATKSPPPRPMPPEAAAPFQARVDELQRRGVGVVGDGCITIVTATKSYGHRYASVGYATDTVDAFADFLAAKNIVVRNRVVPFFCGVKNSGNEQMVAIRDDESAAAVVSLPVVIPKRLRQDGKLIGAYSRLIQKTMLLPLTDPFQASPAVMPSIDISTDEARALMQDLKAKFVFVAYVGGAEVSGPSKFFAHAIPALIGLAATAGRAIFVPTSVAESVTIHGLTLVDLERREVVWKTVRVIPRVSPISAAADREVEVWQGGFADLFFDMASRKPAAAK